MSDMIKYHSMNTYKETKLHTIINMTVFFTLFMCYTLKFLYPPFYAATDKYAGLFVFLMESVLLLNNFNPFEAIKNNTIEQINTYYNMVDLSIDNAITSYLQTADLGGGLSRVVDAVYPVGTIIVGDIHPDVGTWQQVTTVNDRALYIGATTKTALSTENQWAKKMTITLNNVTMAKHTITFNQLTTSTDGAHKHQLTAQKLTTETKMTNDTFPRVNPQPAMGREEVSTNPWSAQTDGHTHTFTVSGSIDGERSHTHTLSWETNKYVYKSGQTKIQPNAYVVHLWKRIA